jgi:hypothetical protein
MHRVTFGESFVPELREILTSTSTVALYGRDGRQTETREQLFTYPWQLKWIGYDSELGQSRVICRLVAEGNVVTAIIDATDFGKLRRNNSKTSAWNGSEYHDMAVLASTLIEEQIVTWDPSQMGNEVHIRLPEDRMA